MKLPTTNYQLPTTQRGFTLIEILVATSLFSMVMIISIGSLVSINDSNKKAQISRTVIDNLNFAMENMTRNMRVGSNYHCDYGVSPITTQRDCPSGTDSIVFEGYKGKASDTGDQIVYRLNTTTRQIESSTNSGNTFIPITAPELTIDILQFYVTGAAPGDGKQPRVVISISGTATFKTGIQSKVNLQSTASQRKLDS
ncbi:MAG: type II secretion system protein [Patescibacteria group bacterium]